MILILDEEPEDCGVEFGVGVGLVSVEEDVEEDSVAGGGGAAEVVVLSGSRTV